MRAREAAALPGDAAARPGATSCAASSAAIATRQAWRRTRRSRPSPRCGCTSTPGAGPACRSIIRAGKCLPVTATEVMVELKRPPLAIFDEISPATSNYFRFRLSPEVVISAGARVKQPGEEMRGEPRGADRPHEPRGETIAVRAAAGRCDARRPSLFTRDDASKRRGGSSIRSLRDVTPVSEYEPGSWGPPAAADIVASDKGWHDPKPEQTPTAAAQEHP